mmetsp:Transcript_39291/g.45078  ORF Transcript_39291/g.45078 Transcript_39291/m.45078 type:complete len:97 (-) Transcript_39291:1006-1296(-)
MNGKDFLRDTFQAFVIFQHSMIIPTPAGSLIIIEVSSSRSSKYKNTIIVMTKLINRVLTEMPLRESLFFQKWISFLNAIISQTVCASDTKIVRTSK